MTLVQLQREDDLFAKFSGQTWVTGTVVGRWPAGAKNTAYKAPEYMLVPDARSVAKLPYFQLKDPSYFNKYRVQVIDLQNGESAIRMAVGAEKAERLLMRKTNVVRATGKFLIESFVVGVECDAPWARGILVKAEVPTQIAAIHQAVPERC
ncbi:MAG: hypothetical protein K2X00_17140 [Nitrospiraceae bacterium]|nr:hypothetical protein [Nitrospiraceae bacterium]